MHMDGLEDYETEWQDRLCLVPAFGSNVQNRMVELRLIQNIEYRSGHGFVDPQSRVSQVATGFPECTAQAVSF